MTDENNVTSSNNTQSDELIIYTDGGCSGNPGPGGWGFVIVDNSGEESIHSGGESITTNNRMELTAVIEALRLVTAHPEWNESPITIFTDSQYVQKGMTQWISGWKRNGWKTASKQPVKNKELWLVLDELTARINPRWKWVKGHAGIHYNEICDSLTQDEIAKHR